MREPIYKCKKYNNLKIWLIYQPVTPYTGTLPQKKRALKELFKTYQTYQTRQNYYAKL